MRPRPISRRTALLPIASAHRPRRTVVERRICRSRRATSRRRPVDPSPATINTRVRWLRSAIRAICPRRCSPRSPSRRRRMRVPTPATPACSAGSLLVRPGVPILVGHRVPSAAEPADPVLDEQLTERPAAVHRGQLLVRGHRRTLHLRPAGAALRSEAWVRLRAGHHLGPRARLEHPRTEHRSRRGRPVDHRPQTHGGGRRPGVHRSGGQLAPRQAHQQPQPDPQGEVPAFGAAHGTGRQLGVDPAVHLVAQ